MPSSSRYHPAKTPSCIDVTRGVQQESWKPEPVLDQFYSSAHAHTGCHKSSLASSQEHCSCTASVQPGMSRHDSDHTHCNIHMHPADLHCAIIGLLCRAAGNTLYGQVRFARNSYQPCPSGSGTPLSSIICRSPLVHPLHYEKHDAGHAA